MAEMIIEAQYNNRDANTVVGNNPKDYNSRGYRYFAVAVEGEFPHSARVHFHKDFNGLTAGPPTFYFSEAKLIGDLERAGHKLHKRAELSLDREE